MPLSEKLYRSIFVGSGLIDDGNFGRVLEEAGSSGRPIEGVIVDLALLTNEEVGKLMAGAYGVDFVNLLETNINPKAQALLPDVVIRKQWVMPYDFKDDCLLVALVDPQNIELTGFIEKRAGMPLKISYITPGILEDVLRSNSKDTLAQIKQICDEFERSIQEHSDKALSQDIHVIEIVDLILQYGYANNASDIHIEPNERFSLVRYRIDGVLHDVIKLSMVLNEIIVSRIKIMAKLRTDEHFSAQDGKLRLKFDNKSVDVRISILPVVEGEKVVMRILSEKGHSFTLNTLGFSERDLKVVKNAVFKPYGMILSTGPTGAGKTTSMYAVLKALNTREVNIQTIEDPVEYELYGINQIQVNALTNLSFANGLRSIVRQDPDIIMVGEIRDAETASISVNAAMTGHLVLSTLHTNDAATAMPRLLDLQVEPFLIASSVKLVIAQRLVREICSHCSAAVSVKISKVKESIPQHLYEKYFGGKEMVKLFAGKGCPMCNQTGFIGRVGIFEVLEMTDAIRDLIMHRANADEVAKKALEQGMTTMFEDGIKKVIKGVTTIEELLRNAVSA